MLGTNTSSSSSVVLIAAAVVLVVALGALAFSMFAPVPPAPLPNTGNHAPQIVAPVAASASSTAGHSTYVSTQTLRNRLDAAYERHLSMRVQTLLSILNGRYQRRCGLPY